uniref:Uncharacterized protein n=1 Tax=Arundo donax TaxID=35708 RepID=A0A0A9CEM7_ARUDO
MRRALGSARYCTKDTAPSHFSAGRSHCSTPNWQPMNGN